MSEVSSADVCFLSVVLFEKRLERWISAEKCCWLNHLFAELNVLALWLVSRTERSGGAASSFPLVPCLSCGPKTRLTGGSVQWPASPPTLKPLRATDEPPTTPGLWNQTRAASPQPWRTWRTQVGRSDVTHQPLPDQNTHTSDEKKNCRTCIY